MKRDLQFPKPNQIVKSEKYETFCVSKLPIWRQNGSPAPGMETRPQCVECPQVVFLVKLNPEFSSRILEEAKATLPLPLFLLASKKKAIIVSFR